MGSLADTTGKTGRDRDDSSGGRPGLPEADGPDGQSLVGLLGETRATILRTLKREGERSAPDLVGYLGISDVAVRRHLAVLERDGLIAERTVKQPRGRPVARYRVTARGEALFPHHYPEVVDDLLDFLQDEQGRDGFRAYLRWRQDRQTEQYATVVDGEELRDRLLQLAGALNEAGFEAMVEECDEGFRLTQTHCAIYETARRHPEMCAHEAAMFRRVLGDVNVSRRQTLAKGDGACVCTVMARPGRTMLPTIQT